MKNEPVFETDSPLWPEDPAFKEIFSGYEGGIHPNKLAHFHPAVICSPRKTGKTTQLRRIFKFQEEFHASVQGISITIPKRDGGLAEHELRDLLAAELKASRMASLVDIIESSKRIEDSTAKGIVAIVDADNLHENALRWLLYGVRRIAEASPPVLGGKVQVIIDGCFAVETMTSPDSEFPMPQLYPREFNKHEQKQFVHNRFKRIGVAAEEDIYQMLWRETHGDKYFTQALCKRLVRRSRLESSPVINARDFNDCLETYVESETKDQLKNAILQSIKNISEHCESDFGLRRLMENLPSKWEVLPKTIRATAYRGGLVRRTSLRGVQLRAPIVLGIYNAVEKQVQSVKALLTSHFDLEGVPESFRASAKAFLDEILLATYQNSLKTLHVGFGRKVSDREIQISAIALDHGVYEGTIDLHTEYSIRRGDELWCLFWTIEDIAGGIVSKLRTLPVMPIRDSMERLMIRRR